MGCFERVEQNLKRLEVVGCSRREAADLGEVCVGEEGRCARCTCQPQLGEGRAYVGGIRRSVFGTRYCSIAKRLAASSDGLGKDGDGDIRWSACAPIARWYSSRACATLTVCETSDAVSLAMVNECQHIPI